MNRADYILSPADIKSLKGMGVSVESPREWAGRARKVVQLPLKPLTPRESMLEALARFERANHLDVCSQLYRRGNAFKYALFLTWALIATAAVLFVISRW